MSKARAGGHTRSSSRDGRRIRLILAMGLSVTALTCGCHRESRSTSVDSGPAAAVRDTTANAATLAPGPAPMGMVWIPGGTFWMGEDDRSFGDAGPVHEVTLDGFWMDRTEVTNRQFAEFVAATEYVTVAERRPDRRDFPDVPQEKLVPGSLVFTPPAGEVSLENPMAWWRYVAGACWRHPEGPGTSIEGKDDYPVVQVCWDDAVAFARWAGKRLPTEAEWEHAARGGKGRRRFVWGDERTPGRSWQANVWQGRFPDRDSAEDGFRGAAPVGRFPPNGFGIVDMSGNVWEWCADWYRPGYNINQARNPTGPTSSFDPDEPGVPKRVQRGGSFLCTDEYCGRYRPGTRGRGAVDTALSHVGFRCVRSPYDRAANAGGRDSTRGSARN
jgi:formylglycine-generating enzyme required for sulfatase activity